MCLLWLGLFYPCLAQTKLAAGEQPQMTVDRGGTVRVVFGQADKIFYSQSTDSGKTFSTPALVGVVNEMHLGMTRGPQLATSTKYSIVTAIDKAGNIHCFRLTHKTGKWEQIGNVNDLDGSAPEGLMGIAADENNNFYAVWLDLRQGGKNNICFSTLEGKSGWKENVLVYTSPDSHVCQCCKPSVAASANTVTIMFRNWLKGSRDLYLITSSDKGNTFSEAQKLGNGTWPLEGCPMDGGGLVIDENLEIHTAWQRQGEVFYDDPGQAELRIGEGRSVGLSGNIITWEKGSDLMIRPMMNGETRKIGEGTALKVQALSPATLLAVWEKEGQIVYRVL